jgi:hypothetical protein
MYISEVELFSIFILEDGKFQNTLILCHNSTSQDGYIFIFHQPGLVSSMILQLLCEHQFGQGLDQKSHISHVAE